MLKKLKFSKYDLEYQEIVPFNALQGSLIIRLQKEFGFYDFENSGHVDFDDATRILKLYEASFEVANQIQSFVHDHLKLYQTNNPYDLNALRGLSDTVVHSGDAELLLS